MVVVAASKHPEFVVTKNRNAFVRMLENVLILVAGITLVLSIPLIPGSASTPRTLDVLGLICAAHLIFRGFHAKWGPISILYGVTTITLILFLLLHTVLSNDVPRAVILVRLIFSISIGISLAIICFDRSRIGLLLFGVWLGALVGVLIAFGQMKGVSFLQSLQPPDLVESAVFGILRHSAIWGHPNAAAQVTMAGAACGLVIWKRQEGHLIQPLVLFLSIAVLNYVIMQNRAPILIGALILFYVIFCYRSFTISFAAINMAFFLLTVVLLSPESIFGARWTGNFGGMSIFDQGHDRLKSTISGFMISLSAPFGLTADERNARLIAEAGVRASHNGFVYSALTVGPIITTLLLWPMIRALLYTQGKRTNRAYDYPIISICIMLLFEDALLEPSIVAILALLTACIKIEENSAFANNSAAESKWLRQF